jgi:hypothetical protein
MADDPFDGSPTYGLGSPTGVRPPLSLIPVDHDPFAPDYVPVDHDLSGVAPSFTLIPVDHDPFNDSWAAGSPSDRDAFGTLPRN